MSNGNVPTGAGNFFPSMPGIFGIYLVCREAVRQSWMRLCLMEVEKKLDRREGEVRGSGHFDPGPL